MIFSVIEIFMYSSELIIGFYESTCGLVVLLVFIIITVNGYSLSQ